MQTIQCVGGSILVTIGNQVEVVCTKSNEQINVNEKSRSTVTQTSRGT